MACFYLPLRDASSPSASSGNDAGWALRLITLRRGARDSDVVCDMEHALIGSVRNSYEALSYV
jgi:hypothetical protein